MTSANCPNHSSGHVPRASSDSPKSSVYSTNTIDPLRSDYEGKWMQLALAQAHLAKSQGEVPVGAVVVQDHSAIALAHNLRETSLRAVAHAEIIAIEKANRALGQWRLSECDLYVTLEPCPMCLAACQQARFRNVFYGACDPKGGAISLGYSLHADDRLNHRFSVTLRREESSSQLLKDFFVARRKNKTLPETADYECNG